MESCLEDNQRLFDARQALVWEIIQSVNAGIGVIGAVCEIHGAPI